MATPGRARAPGKPWLSRIGEKERFMLLLVAPAASVLILFQIVPIFIGADASFRDWKLYDPQKIWIGWEHYAYVLTDPVFMGQRVLLGEAAPEHETGFDGGIDVTEQLGSEMLVGVGAAGTEIMMSRIDPQIGLKLHEKVRLSLNPAHLHFFDRDSEQAIV